MEEEVSDVVAGLYGVEIVEAEPCRGIVSLEYQQRNKESNREYCVLTVVRLSCSSAEILGAVSINLWRQSTVLADVYEEGI